MSTTLGKAPPFWDQPALKPASEYPSGSNQISPGVFSSGLIASGIQTALPESPNDPWPDSLSPWDTIKVAGMRAPGIARIHGGRRKRFNPQIIPGLNGHVPNFYGYDCAEFTIKLTIWTPAQWAWLYQFIALIQPPPTSKIQPLAVKIDYPSLRLMNVYDCYVVHVSIPELHDKQEVTIDIPCVEYLLPTGLGPGPLQPATEVKTNADGTNTVSSKQPPADPSITSIGP